MQKTKLSKELEGILAGVTIKKSPNGIIIVGSNKAIENFIRILKYASLRESIVNWLNSDETNLVEIKEFNPSRRKG